MQSAPFRCDGASILSLRSRSASPANGEDDDHDRSAGRRAICGLCFRRGSRNSEKIAEIYDQIFGWRRWGPSVGALVGDRARGLSVGTATPGTSCRTTWRAARRIAGARTASPASATAISSSASPPRSGTAAIRSSRSGSSASPRRGQPRRGRQGILLPSRQPAVACLHEVSLQVSAGANFPIGG